MGSNRRYGGTAGGGRSGGRGSVTYSRVIPKFLQKLADPESISNPLDAKRPWSTSHVQERKPRDDKTDKGAMRPRDAIPKDEIERLEAQGFIVVATGGVDTERPGERKNETEPDFGGRPPRGNDDKLQVVGGIEKKSRRAQNSTMRKAFDMKNKHKLSFVESDSEDE